MLRVITTLWLRHLILILKGYIIIDQNVTSKRSTNMYHIKQSFIVFLLCFSVVIFESTNGTYQPFKNKLQYFFSLFQPTFVRNNVQPKSSFKLLRQLKQI